MSEIKEFNRNGFFDDISNAKTAYEIGKIGETYVKEYLSQFFNLIETKGTDNFSDFYDLDYNIQIEVKATKNITIADYNNFNRDVKLHKPKLAIFISTRAPIVFRMEVNPLRLYCHIDDLDIKQVNFIKNSYFLNETEYKEELLNDELLDTLDEIKQLSSKTTHNDKIVNVVMKNAPECILSNEKFDVDKRQIYEFLIDNKHKFESITPNSHIQADYNEWCKRKKYNPIKGQKNYLAKLIREYCVGCMKSYGSNRCGYVLNTCDIAKKYIDDIESFIQRNNIDDIKSNLLTSFNEYTAYIKSNN